MVSKESKADPSARSAPGQSNPVNAECGCKSGMVALLIGLTLSTYWFFFHEPNAASWFVRLVYVLSISFGCALAGKIIGMIVPRLRRSSQKKRSATEEEAYGTRGL